MSEEIRKIALQCDSWSQLLMIYECDVAEYCSSESAECPSDAFVGADVQCLPANYLGEICEPVLCTGAAALCPIPDDHPIKDGPSDTVS